METEEDGSMMEDVGSIDYEEDDDEGGGEGEDEEEDRGGGKGKEIWKTWVDNFKKDEMMPGHLKNYWRLRVPPVYGPKVNVSCLDWLIDEELTREELIDPLEFFLAGDPGAERVIIEENSVPSSVCGRVFKMGEPTYVCRECGLDPTCVLCVDCFKHSTHRGHKYKMGTSGGGGCCDCGDEEAWKKDPWCSIHAAGKKATINSVSKPRPPLYSEETASFASSEVGERAHIVFAAALHYAYQLLTLESSLLLPAYAAPRRKRDSSPQEEGGGPNTSSQTPSVSQLPPSKLLFIDPGESGTSGRRRSSRRRSSPASSCPAATLGGASSSSSSVSPTSTTDSFCTLLYNDETHTFEQVIGTLTRVTKCSQRDAVEFVTNIDREGRAVVKCASFQECLVLKEDIERFTSRHGSRPLKVMVVHSDIVAHQAFALRLLTWLQKTVSGSECLRTVFSQVALEAEEQGERSPLEGILKRDAFLWKSARLHWHRLFISGMLMEYENKKAFSRVFTKNYASVMQDFIRDDHDHSFSIASLAVQVFTVPTLSHYLISHEEVLLILLNTFNSECSTKCNRAGKLEFERNVPGGGPFKRSIYILYDLRYLLSIPPKEWTDELRKGFLQGISFLLNLLNFMQGMDSVTRQVGQHMEYEPEWESAFNLHIKLAPVITLALKWCSTDRVVLVKAYRLTLKKLYENPCFDQRQACEVRELANHSASCIQYDVASQPVSIHLPLSRFLAGLHLHLEKFGLNFDSQEFQIGSKPTPEQIIEPILRTQVMIAQVHAGMWRRNGYSLSNQIYFYHNVKCRGEMMDKDIALLQVGASLIESNEFLIHLLNKFNLINWASPTFESENQLNSKFPEDDGMRQTISLVEEFLSLLITIVGERFVPGVGMVTQDECIKKEITQLLCVLPFSHSQLNKCLPEDVNHETGMERVINDVAVFKKPNQASGKGVYELKPEYYSQYNVFYYHYTKEDMSKSEEEQSKRQKSTTGLECCPPPILPPLTEAFSMVANLLQCDVMLHIMRTILDRSVNLRARSFSEAQVQKVLHLIGYALQEEEQGHSQFLTFVDRAEKWGLEGALEKLYGNTRVEAHHDLLRWTIDKFRKVAEPKRKKASVGDRERVLEEARTTEQLEKEAKARIARERRAQIMAQMAALQQNFMKDNAQLFENIDSEESTAMDVESNVLTSGEVVEVEEPVALGPSQTPASSDAKTYTCILCQEDQSVSPTGPAMVLAAFVQKSTVLCRKRPNSATSSSEDQDSHSTFLTSNLGPAPHASTCGHVMHSTCWQKYFDNVLAKENRRPYRLRQPTSFDVEKNEYLCPLCECLNNTVLPLVPPLASLPNSRSKDNVDKLSFRNWLDASSIAIRHKRRVERTRAAAAAAAAASALTPEDGSSSASSGSQVKAGGREPEKRRRERSGTGSSKDEENGGGGGSMTSSTPSGEEPMEIGGQGEDEDDDEEDDLGGSAVGGSSTPLDRIISLGESDVVMQLRVYPVDKGAGGAGKLEGEGDDDSSDGESTNEGSEEKKKKKRTGLSTDLLEMVMLFCQTAYVKGLGVNPHGDDPRVPLMAWKCTAYTIHSLERLLRTSGKPLFGGLSCRQEDCLESLVRLSGVLGTAWESEQTVNRHGVKLLSMLLSTGGNSPLNASSSPPPTILDWDPFGVLVPLTATLPSVFYFDPVPVPTGTALESHSFALTLLSAVAQILLQTELPRLQPQTDDDKNMEGDISQEKNVLPEKDSKEDSGSLEILLQLIERLLGPGSSKGIDPLATWTLLKSSLRPFLRSSAIFYRHLTGVVPPTSLTQVDGDTFENLAAYLGLPTTCPGLLGDPSVKELFSRWSNALMLSRKRGGSTGLQQPSQVDPLALDRLVSLPDDYSELINAVSLFTCPNSDREDSRNPTMCLVCGEMLCSQTYCCQTELNKTLVGACTYHAQICGAGVGMFLRVRDCEVLLLAAPSRGCFMTPPYLDDYGETDQGLRRGNPLHLCPERYKKLHLLWLSHSLYEEIARSIESPAHSLINTQWQHL